MATTPQSRAPAGAELEDLRERVSDLERTVADLGYLVTTRSDGRPKHLVAKRLARRYVVDKTTFEGGQRTTTTTEYGSVADVAEYIGYRIGTVSARLSEGRGTWRTRANRQGCFYVVKRVEQ